MQKFKINKITNENENENFMNEFLSIKPVCQISSFPVNIFWSPRRKISLPGRSLKGVLKIS